MADGSDQGRKGHDEGAGSHRRFELHPEERCKHHQHHHPAAGSHEAGSKADGQAKEQRDHHALQVQLFTFAGSILPAGVGLHQKADANEEGQKERETAEYHIADDKCDITADGAHGQDTRQHDPPAPKIDVLVLRVGVCGNRRAEDV